MKYCESIFSTKRFKTREVRVGKIIVGGSAPIAIQSMTTSPTDDVEATTAQIIRLADSGCHIARVTVQGKKEALACEAIKNNLLKQGYDIPLVADIHFFPPAALLVADFVDKVRINPGNFADPRATFKQVDSSETRIEEKFAPLVLKCKALKKAMRIGCNHGSLSDRIMSEFGDSPRGMVESAFEYARIARKYDYHDLIFSMKASNPVVMIQAYRLLVAEMMKLGWDYPIHLGVTEAGEGEDGRIKSAIGIGSLLLDGIGDTVRVSLTEDPWLEIDPCERLIRLAKGEGIDPFIEKRRSPFEFERRKVVIKETLSLHKDSSVIGYEKGDVVLKEEPPLLAEWNKKRLFKAGSENQFVRVREEGDFTALKEADLIFLQPKASAVHFARKFFEYLKEHQILAPVILNFRYDCSQEDLVIKAALECGSLLCDGLGDGLMLEGPYEAEFLEKLSFNILQGSRRRSTKTEFISCPSCGRTLFHLQETAAKIRQKTGHLPGVKIAIMGCIVNGPGEMADADFGYVGSKAGKVDLYVGKECYEKGIESNDAPERLVALIKAHGKWLDPSL